MSLFSLSARTPVEPAAPTFSTTAGPAGTADSVGPEAALFNEQLRHLYGVAERSQYVFASPIGPFYHEGRHYPLPRFVYFGPHSSAESVRIAVLAGFDHHDLRGTTALLHFIERLSLAPELGEGLNLSFFPLVDVLGHARGITRSLADASWSHGGVPEINLLAKDFRVRGYQAFVRLETNPAETDLIEVRLRGADGDIAASGVELVSSSEFDPFPVRFEVELDSASVSGPLSLADDLPFAPFELTLRLPAGWSVELHREAVALILKRIIQRYRGHQAYGRDL